MAETPKDTSTFLHSEEAPWYKPQGGSITPTTRAFLEGYNSIGPEEVEDHVLKARDIAWEFFPSPCIGEFLALSFDLSKHPFYPDLLARLKSTPPIKFLDLGTYLGQDLRKLVYDGAPKESLFGSDLFPKIEEAGHLTFRDESTFRDSFLAADIFDESEESALVKSKGTWDVISIFMFLHLFSLEDAERACKRILKLLSPKPESWIIGTQTGSINPGDFPLISSFVEKKGERPLYRHNRETFIEIWQKVMEDEGVKLDIWAEYHTQEGHGKAVESKFLRSAAFSNDHARGISVLSCLDSDVIKRMY